MPSTISLISRLRTDYPTIIFTTGSEFRWSPTDRTVVYCDNENYDASALLHELSHAILGHTDYSKDILLLEMERSAWHYAQKILGPTYAEKIKDETAENALDTYRDWLHTRSTCPHCQATGIQVKKKEYKCLACRTQWRVNEARICALRRYTL